MVVVELATNGPLLRYLRGHRTQNYDDMNEYTLDIPLKQRLDIAIGVADGMSHLGKMKVRLRCDHEFTHGFEHFSV